MQEYLFITVVILLTLTRLPLQSQNNKYEANTASSTQERLQTMMQTYHRYNMFNGAVLVAEQGKIIYKDAFGLANREWDIPNTTDTKFMIGSISKPFTAMLVLLQVQKGLLHLDSTLAKYLPEFIGKPAANVTLSQLLSHTSGMPNYDIMRNFFPFISRQHFERTAYLNIFKDSALAFTPGTKYYYSSWAYFTLGLIVERITGKSYSEAMREEIFDKIAMNNSGSYFHTQIVPKRSTGYDYTIGGFTSSDFRDQSNTMGTGDMYSTVEDLWRFHQAIQNNTLLNPVLTAKMLTPGIPPARYGFGWFNQTFKITPTDSVATNFHLGMTDGFISFLRRIPSTNTMVVILCNSSPTDFFGITNNLLKILYNQPIALKQPIHKVMETRLGQSNDSKGRILNSSMMNAEKAVAECAKLSADTARYYTDWISMNFLTEQLLNAKRFEEARILGEYNATTFSNKDLVMLTLGNVYRALHRTEEAIKYYKKTLEITPDYIEAKNCLQELGSIKK